MLVVEDYHLLADAVVRGLNRVGFAVDTVVGLYKTELINRRGPWRTLEQVELATAEWTDWWNQRHNTAARPTWPAITNISRSWIYRLLQRFREGGYASLESRSPRPRSCSHQAAAVSRAKS